jgi:hypothetical protein
LHGVMGAWPQRLVQAQPGEVHVKEDVHEEGLWGRRGRGGKGEGMTEVPTSPSASPSPEVGGRQVVPPSLFRRGGQGVR